MIVEAYHSDWSLIAGSVDGILMGASMQANAAVLLFTKRLTFSKQVFQKNMRDTDSSTMSLVIGTWVIWLCFDFIIFFSLHFIDCAVRFLHFSSMVLFAS